ncbi:hypothetical protein [Alloscardovia macacae]|uniref:DUF11 domain-containing protein n=1 Tax=Alloscardovia macacae TaxID=1160091 RepID=A0A261F732_9BIFI|nr:hypothetical protein [Alloscardovia macacae]OZG54951.1 hypothetical protein ALMA_0276 [Alloscardovia macacae]
MNISTRKFSSWRCRTVLTLLAALVTCLSLLCPPASLTPAHAAPFPVDLVPHLVREVGEGGVLTNYGVQGAEFTWHVVVENAGRAVARDVTFDLAIPAGTTEVHATCARKTFNADCPTDDQLKVAPATLTEDGHLTGTIPYILGTQFSMSRESVTIQVTGRYPFRDQVTPTLSVAPAAEAIDTNPYDNETAEIIHLQPVTVPVSVKIEQDTPDLHSGAERHYTVTYANDGDADAPVTLNAQYASASPSQSDTLSTSVTCTTSSTAPCPLGAEDEHPAAESLLSTAVTLPAHTALVVDVRVTHTIPARRVSLDTAPLPQPVNLTASMASTGTVRLTGTVRDQSAGSLTPDAFSTPEASKEEALPEIDTNDVPVYTEKGEPAQEEALPDIPLDQVPPYSENGETIPAEELPEISPDDVPTYSEHGDALTEEALPEIENGALPTTTLLTVPQYSTITADLVREHVHAPEGASTAITGAYPDTSTPGDKTGVSVLVTLRQGIPVGVTVPVRVVPVTYVPSEHLTSEREEFPLDEVPPHSEVGAPLTVEALPEISLSDVPVYTSRGEPLVQPALSEFPLSQVPAAAPAPEPEKVPAAKSTQKRLARTGSSVTALILLSCVLVLSAVALRVRVHVRSRMRRH